MALVDYFLKIDGAPGESMDSKHKDEIEVLSWNFGASQSASAHGGTGSGTGKVQIQDLTVTHYFDTASTDLLKYLTTGKHIDEGMLTVRKAGGTAVEYLKVLAISRLYLSNFLNVQSSWVTQGLKVCQMGLRFGGNDVGSVMLEENVVRAAGVTNCTTEEELRRIIRDAGFKPVQRDTLYRTYFLN